MAVTQSGASLIAVMAMFATVFSLIVGSLAAESPAPSPVSSSGMVSPSLAVGCAITFVVFVVGSARKI